MTEKTALIDYVLAHSRDDEDVSALETVLSIKTDNALEKALALVGKRHCPPLEQCELATLPLDCHRDC